MEMLKLALCIFITAISITGYNKTKENRLPVPDSDHYQGKLTNKFEGFAGPLDFFSIVFNLDGTTAGTVDVQYNNTVTIYSQALLIRTELKSDSVQIDFACRAYPNVYREFKGLSNSANNSLTADCFGHQIAIPPESTNTGL